MGNLASLIGMPIVLTGGTLRTLAADQSVAESLVILNDRIAAVGTSAEMLRIAGENALVVHLGGRTVLPGLIDAHTHLEATALHLSRFADCHVPPHHNLAGILGALAAHAENTPRGEWVIGQGSFMLAEKLDERRYPTLAEMDAAVPEHPAALRAGAHITILNSRALEQVGIDADYVPPAGGFVQRDGHGNPTGFTSELYGHLGLPPVSLEETKEAIAQTAALLSSFGVTSLQDQYPSTNGLRAYQELQREGRLPLRITFTVHCPNLAAVQQFLRLGIETGFGNEWLKFGAVKFFADGGITGAAGVFYDDYTHQPGNRGHLKVSQEEMNAMLRTIDAAGCQISTHIVGDRAMDMMLDAYAQLPDTVGRRHRLEHVGHLCLTQERIERIKAMGLVPVVTMPFLSSFGDFLEEHLGPRANGAFALRRMLDNGMIVPGSSDCAGAQPESLNPFFGMWCSVTRETYLGNQLAPEEAVSALEALHTYTTAAAWVDFEEHERGTLEAGKLADLIVCDADPTELPDSALKHFTPSATILGGRLVSGSLHGYPGSVQGN